MDGHSPPGSYDSNLTVAGETHVAVVRLEPHAGQCRAASGHRCALESDEIPFEAGARAVLASVGSAAGCTSNVVQVTDSPFLKEKARQQQPHLEALRERYSALSSVVIPLFPQEVRGIERLHRVGQILCRPSVTTPGARGDPQR